MVLNTESVSRTPSKISVIINIYLFNLLYVLHRDAAKDPLKTQIATVSFGVHPLHQTALISNKIETSVKARTITVAQPLPLEDLSLTNSLN